MVAADRAEPCASMRGALGVDDGDGGGGGGAALVQAVAERPRARNLEQEVVHAPLCGGDLSGAEEGALIPQDGGSGRGARVARHAARRLADALDVGECVELMRAFAVSSCPVLTGDAKTFLGWLSGTDVLAMLLGTVERIVPPDEELVRLTSTVSGKPHVHSAWGSASSRGSKGDVVRASR